MRQVLFRDEKYSAAGRLAALLHLASLTHSQTAEAEKLASRVDLELFRQEVTRTSAWVFATKQAQRLGLARICDPRWLGDLESHETRAKAKAEWVSRMLAAFNAAEVRAIPLKGGLLGPLIYGDSGYKKMNDFDFLIEFKNAGKAIQAIKKLGFVSLGEKIGKKEISEKTHHAPPFFSPDLACVLGVHWNLCQINSVYNISSDDLWQDAVPIKVEGQQAWRMTWERHLAHLCVHLPFYKIGIRELADVYNLILFCDPKIDWDAFIALVNRWQASGPVYRVLRLASAALDLDTPLVPAPVLEEFRQAADEHWVEDTDRRAALGPAFIWTRSVHIGKIEKLFSVSILSHKYAERVKSWRESWRQALFPDYEEIEKFLLVPPGESAMKTFKARVQFPKVCLGEMIRDHGAKEFMLLTLWNFSQVGLWSLREPLGMNPKSEPSDELTIKLINQLE